MSERFEEIRQERDGRRVRWPFGIEIAATMAFAFGAAVAAVQDAAQTPISYVLSTPETGPPAALDGAQTVYPRPPLVSPTSLPLGVLPEAPGLCSTREGE
jgi:hypothetical protein